MAKRKQIVNSRKQPLGVDADSTPRAERGRTGATETPVHIHSHGVELPDALVEQVQTKLGAKIGAFALQIERVAVRFEDLNGPRGGKDCECRIQIVLAGRPNIVVIERSTDPRRAFEGANKSVGRAVKRDLQRAGFSQGMRAARKNAKHAGVRAEPPPSVQPAADESPAPRNLKGRTPRSAAALEVSTTGARPSRTSTRKSANRVRSGQKLAQRARDEARAPRTRAAAAQARD